MPMLTLSPEQNDGLYCYQEEDRAHYELYECTRQGEPLARIDHDAVSVYISGEIESDGTHTRNKFAEWAEAGFYMPSDVNPALSD